MTGKWKFGQLFRYMKEADCVWSGDGLIDHAGARTVDILKRQRNATADICEELADCLSEGAETMPASQRLEWIAKARKLCNGHLLCKPAAPSLESELLGMGCNEDGAVIRLARAFDTLQAELRKSNA
jgi:hypothetical protein